jgi:haloacetate dehalogenase
MGGTGEPVLLLHGYPQTRAMWHRVAPTLAEHHTVVAADLRGYGDSSKPPGDESHDNYSKRAMARDQLEAMAALGHERFAVVGHDRGGRVAHRMAIDRHDAVTRLAVLDIVPTRAVFDATDAELATAYYHWFFLSQPYDLPERLIGADPAYYLRRKLASWAARPDVFAREALAEYERCFADPATIHGSCEDYRAAASIDLEHDRADDGRRIACPLLVLWGAHGVVERKHDPLALWRERADDVRGHALDCGHFLAEERPEETAAELSDFLRG